MSTYVVYAVLYSAWFTLFFGGANYIAEKYLPTGLQMLFICVGIQMLFICVGMAVGLVVPTAIIDRLFSRK